MVLLLPPAAALGAAHQALDLRERRGHDVSAQRRQLAGIDLAAIGGELAAAKTLPGIAKIWPAGLVRSGGK